MLLVPPALSDDLRRFSGPAAMGDYRVDCALCLAPLLAFVAELVARDPLAARRWREPLARAGELPEFREPLRDPSRLAPHQELLAELFGAIISPLAFHEEARAALVPFTLEPVLATPRFARLFAEPGAPTRHPARGAGQEALLKGRAIRAYLLVLAKCYGQRHQLLHPILRHAQDPATGLDRIYHLKLDLRFVEVVLKGELPRLDEGQLARVLDRLAHPEELLELLPPERFGFHGFSLVKAEDATLSEMIAALSWDLIDQNSVVTPQGFARLQDRLRTIFGRPRLLAGLAALRGEEVYLLNLGCDPKASCLFADSQHVPQSLFADTPYERAALRQEVIRVPDVLADPSLHRLLSGDGYQGHRSLLIAPLAFQGRTIGTLAIGSPDPGDLTSLDALVLDQLRPLFALALKKALDDLEASIQSVIKEKCTAVHPAVEWRFRRAALKRLEARRLGQEGELEEIVFPEVYPLYGICDVRGSSEARNQAMRADLSHQLALGLAVLERARDWRALPLFQELAGRTRAFQERLKDGIRSGDELLVADFLRGEVAAVFKHLKEAGPAVEEAMAAYQGALDPRLGTVHVKRQEYETSIQRLNDRLAAYLDREARVMQAACPHYFERHRTDGVDYLIYAGASLLEKGGFDSFHLENLRLWQLLLACGLAWHAEELKASLPVPLAAAQLILVQNAPLSIRFRYDEKRFDVDGAYDVRHQIIRSRLDKAVVAGDQERLTQPGKLAIVYSAPEEAAEMRRHLDFLKR